MSEENTENKNPEPEEKKPEAEKPKSKNQVIVDKVEFIRDRGWDQYRAGNQATELVWKDPKDGNISNLETAYLMEKIRVNKEKAGSSTPPGGDSKQGQKTILPLTADQKKELEKKAAADKKLADEKAAADKKTGKK